MAELSQLLRQYGPPPAPSLPQATPPAFPSLPQATPPAFPSLPQATPPAFPSLPQATPPAVPSLPQAYPPAFPSLPQAYPPAFPALPQATPPAFPSFPSLHQLNRPDTLTLLPEKKHRVKTRVLRKTLEPAFDETFSFYGVAAARVPELALHFNVLSFDRFSRDRVIGETLVPLAGLDLSEGRVLMSREIVKRNVKKCVGRGELLLSLCYQSTSNTLTVVVLKARQLPRTENNNGPIDPYVKVNLYQGKKRVSKKKAHVKKCTPNPVFNDVFVFDLPSDGGLRDTSVELLLLDSERARGGGGGDSHGSKPVLGRLVLGTDAPGTPGQHWREICEHPRRQIAKWHAMLED
ncbi:unnamed protein product [Arctogadus glacialis]